MEGYMLESIIMAFIDMLKTLVGVIVTSVGNVYLARLKSKWYTHERLLQSIVTATI